MDARIFNPEHMELKQDLLSVSNHERITYSAKMDILFAHLAGYTVKTKEDIDAVKTTIVNLLRPLGKKVYAIGNYDGFNINPDLIEAYTEMQKYLTQNHFSKVSRYTTSAFLRMKLGASPGKARAGTTHLRKQNRGASVFRIQ